MCVLALLGVAAAFGAARAFGQDDPAALEEIIVTATKRPRSVQDVPLAVTALTRDMIESAHVETVRRLTDLSPSVMFDQAHSYQNSSLKIRGIGTIGVSRTFEGAVGVFVDDVYRSRSGMALSDLLDIDRIEIMRGPQGALFGKNTVAGAIAMHSAPPAVGRTGGRLEIGAGNLSSREVSGVLNASLGDATAVRFAGKYRVRDGSFTSPDTGAEYDAVDRHGFKVQLSTKPAEDLELRLIADYAESDADCCWASAEVVNGPTTPLIETYANLNGLSFVRAPRAAQERSISLNTVPREIIRDKGILARLDWRIADDVTLKSVTAFREWTHNHIDGDPDYTGADLFVLNEPADIENVSEEINVTMLAGRTNLLLGLYYEKEDFSGSRSVDTGRDADNYLNALISANQGATACLPPVVSADCLFPTGVDALLPDGEFTHELYAQTSETYALFANALTPLTGRLDLDVGIRYDVQTKHGGVDNVYWYDSPIVRAARAAQGIPDDGTPRNGFDLIGTEYSPSFHESTRDTEWTGSLGLQYEPAEHLMLYGKYSRGYKAGGVNLYREAVLTGTRTYAPEFAKSYEIGAKAGYWDGRATTNVAAFHTTYSDLQINFFDGLNFRTENAGKARARGVEIENRFQVFDALGIDFSATYLDAAFEEVSDPLLSYLRGRGTPRAPDWAAVARLDYEKSLRNGFSLEIHGMESYTGDHFVGADVAGERKVDGYSITDASIGLRQAEAGWEALLWCTNCGDVDYRTIYFNSTFQPGSYSAFLNNPRRYGVTLRKTF